MSRYYNQVARVAAASRQFETAGRVKGSDFDALGDVVEEVERAIASRVLAPTDDDDHAADTWLDRNRLKLRPELGLDGRIPEAGIDAFPPRLG